MKKLLAVCSVIILLLPLTARADLFSEAGAINSQILYGSGGYVYDVPSSMGSTKVLDLGYSLQNTGSCGSFKLSASLKHIFNKDAMQSYLHGLGANAISSAPLLLMSYVSPTLANTFMHLKTSAEKILSIRNSQCESVQKDAMELGVLMRARQEGKYECMMKEQQEGKGIDQAAEDCLGASDIVAKYLPLNATNNNQMSSNINVSQNIKELTGMTDSQYQLFQTAVGDMSLNGNSLTDNEVKNPVNKIYDKNVQLYMNKINKVVGDIGSGTINKAELEQIHDQTGVLITPTILVDLYNMHQSDPYAASIYENMLANKLALHKLNMQILQIESDLEIAKEKATNQGNKALAEMLDKKAKLELERKKLEEKELAAEDSSKLLLQIHEQEIRTAVNENSKGESTNNKVIYDNIIGGSVEPANSGLHDVEAGSKAVFEKYIPQ